MHIGDPRERRRRQEAVAARSWGSARRRTIEQDDVGDPDAGCLHTI